MALLQREDWYDLARTTSWTPRYVAEEELFPPFLSDDYGISSELWDKYDEPYKCSYREYVRLQHEKDLAVYSIKSALERPQSRKKVEPGWSSVLKAHYPCIVQLEFSAVSTGGRFTRFFRAGGARNMGTFAAMDEMRHAQLQLFFAYAHLREDRQFDWTPRGLSSNNLISVAIKHAADDVLHTRDVVSASVMTNFCFETAFTNLQFIALSADAARGGDNTFSNLLLSIQSDEARHAQIAIPVLRLMLEAGKKAEAQRLIDVGFWRMWKLFSTLTGITMDYYTPVEQRQHSFKEFMHERVIGEFEQQLRDLGLDHPWYWEIFKKDIDVQHHGQHLRVWLSRELVWFNPAAGVSTSERVWLEQKYPGWNETFGRCWDVITENVRNGNLKRAQLETLPVLCPMSNLPVTGIPGDRWETQLYPLEHQGKRYLFGSGVDRWIFMQEPQRYQGFQTIVERFFEGVIQPQTPEGMISYLGVSAESGGGGHDVHDFAWAFEAPESTSSRSAAKPATKHELSKEPDDNADHRVA